MKKPETKKKKPASRKRGTAASIKRPTRGANRTVEPPPVVPEVPAAATEESTPAIAEPAAVPDSAAVEPPPVAPEVPEAAAAVTDDAIVYCHWNTAKLRIKDGDLLLKRAKAPSLIASAGRSLYDHAAMAAWWRGNLMILEMVQWHGARCVPFVKRVAALPGRWDVFQANPDARYAWSPGWAVQEMISLLGENYGWWNLLKASLCHLAIVRLFARPNNRRRSARRPFRAPRAPERSTPCICWPMRARSPAIWPDLCSTVTDSRSFPRRMPC